MTVSENSNTFCKENCFNINPNCRELIKKGVCKADCCGVVPMEYRKFLQVKSKAYIKDFELRKFKTMKIEYCVAIPEDFKCVFLNRETFECEIYNSPRKSEICRKFGTSKTDPLLACVHINEDKKDIIEKVADNVLNDIKKMRGE